MNLIDYIILSLLILASLYILYRAFFKKEKCADCSENMTCSQVKPKDFEEILKQKTKH